MKQIHRLLAAVKSRTCAIVASVHKRMEQGAAIILFAVLCGGAVFMTGDAAYQLQGVAMGFARLALLLLWALFAGWMLDDANGVKFSEDRDLIKAGNMAVALSRTIGYAALVIAGALLIARI